MTLKIGHLATLTGTSAPTIRYYEEIGLLPRAGRKGGQRHYAEDDVPRLTFIRQCRAFGFAIPQTRDLLALMEDRNRRCADAGIIVREQLAALRAKLKELKALERSLENLIDDGQACGGGAGPDCIILKDLAAGRRKARVRPARKARGR